MTAVRLSKDQVLAHWRSMKRRRKLEPQVIPYKQAGSKYAEDTIRITGSRAFIDGVLSRLTELLEYENGQSRLQVSYQQVVDRDSGLPVKDSFACHIQVHERGPEAKHFNALVGFGG